MCYIALFHDLATRYNRPMTSPLSAYEQVQTDIADACLAAGRQASEVQLLAVSKRQTAANIRALADCGQMQIRTAIFNTKSQKLTNVHKLHPLQRCAIEVSVEKFSR